MGHGLEVPRKLMRIGNGTSLLCSHRTGLCLPEGERTHSTSSCCIVLNHRLHRPNPQGWAATSLTASSENPGLVDGKSFKFPFHTCSLKSDVIDAEGILRVGLELLYYSTHLAFHARTSFSVSGKRFIVHYVPRCFPSLRAGAVFLSPPAQCKYSININVRNFLQQK